jgi:hypothetical protein
MAALEGPTMRVQGLNMRAGAAGRAGKAQGSGFRADAIDEWAGRVVQVTGDGVDRERLVLGQPLPLLYADPGPTAHSLVATGQRDHRRQRHWHEMHPAANRGRRGAQHLGERQRLGTGHVVSTPRCRPALHRRQHRPGQVRHVNGLLQLPTAARHRHHQRHREA